MTDYEAIMRKHQRQFRRIVWTNRILSVAVPTLLLAIGTSQWREGHHHLAIFDFALVAGNVSAQVWFYVKHVRRQRQFKKMMAEMRAEYPELRDRLK